MAAILKLKAGYDIGELAYYLALYKKYLPGNTSNEYVIDPGKAFEAMKKAHHLLWPNQEKVWNDWTERAFQSHCEGGKWVAWAGPAGSGKSYTAGKITNIFFFASPKDRRVACISTTADSAAGRIWKCVKDLMYQAKQNHPEDLLFSEKAQPAEFYWGKKVDKANCVILTPVQQGKQMDRQMNTIVGIHPDGGYLVIVDEGPFIPSGIVSGFSNLERGTPFFQAITIGNSNSRFDTHGLMATPLLGWESVDRHRDREWPTAKGVCIYFNPFDSPAIIHPDEEVRKFYIGKGFPTLESIEEAKDEKGENSVEFWQQTLGWWPPDTAEKVILNENIITKGKLKEKAIWYPRERTRIAMVDPAFTSGGDKCVFVWGEIGYEQTGRKILEYMGMEYIEIEADSGVDAFLQVARKTKALCKQLKIPITNLAIDVHGTGMGLTGVIDLEWQDEPGSFFKIESAGKGSDLPADRFGDKLGKDVYINRQTEMWFSIKRYVQNYHLRNMPEAAIRQFKMRTFEKKDQDRFVLETKEEFKSRLKAGAYASNSPDEADACAGLLEIAKHKFNFLIESPETVNQRKESWKINLDDIEILRILTGQPGSETKGNLKVRSGFSGANSFKGFRQSLSRPVQNRQR